MSIKQLNKVMRCRELNTTAKALYSYLYVRADYKTNKAYPTQKQIKYELGIAQSTLTNNLNILIAKGLIAVQKESSIEFRNNNFSHNVYYLLETYDE